MTHDQFAYWLQGFVEMNEGKYPTPEQWNMIKNHLKLCFLKVTPAMGGVAWPNLNHVPPGEYKPFNGSMPTTMFPPEFIPHGGFVSNKGGGGC